MAADSLILCYHAVSDEWPERFAVSTGQLGEQVEHLLGRGYRPVTFSEAVSGTVPRALAVTFDDAFRSVPERALPVLSDLGVPATVFVSTGLVDGPLHIGYEQWLDTPHRDELVAASWDQLASLIEAGWEIGSHTRSHPYLTELDDESLQPRAARITRGVARSAGASLRDARLPLRGRGRPRRRRRTIGGLRRRGDDIRLLSLRPRSSAAASRRRLPSQHPGAFQAEGEAQASCGDGLKARSRDPPRVQFAFRARAAMITS